MDDEGNAEAKNVVPLLQKVLQLYASEFLLSFSPSQAMAGLDMEGMLPASAEDGGVASDAMDRVLKSDEQEWNAQLETLAKDQTCTQDALLVELQKKKEMIILGMRGGMYEQRVLVEYLQELEERIQAAFGDGEKDESGST